MRRISTLTRWRLATEWCAAGDLAAGDKVLLQDHRRAAAWAGALEVSKDWARNEGYLMGLLVGDGTVSRRPARELSIWARPAVGNSDIGRRRSAFGHGGGARCRAPLQPPRDFSGWHQGRPAAANSASGWAPSPSSRASSACVPGRQTVTPAIERGSSEFYRGFLRGLFDTDGSVQGNADEGRVGAPRAVGPQHARRRAAHAAASRHRLEHLRNRAQHELVITGENVARFAELIGFADTVKRARLARLLGSYKRTLNRERFVATVESVRADGMEDVYDVQIPGINEFDANGLHAHNCGEQPLPPYGSCLLGSVNLTRFVKNAFTDFAEFDWNEYREVVKVFTRMLDNVCEINGLPLEQQRDEIMRKRRHGMGFLGLGSTITCLGMKYGAEDSVKFTEDVSREMAVAGWEAALELAKEKGPAPIMKEEFTRHRRDAAQASGDDARTAGRSAT